MGAAAQGHALIFLLAGSTVEDVFFRHHPEHGLRGDIRMYLLGIERRDGLRPDEIGPLMKAGGPAATTLITDNQDAVARVRDLLLAQVPQDSAGGYLDFGHPLSVSCEEARWAVLNLG